DSLCQTGEARCSRSPVPLDELPHLPLGPPTEAPTATSQTGGGGGGAAGDGACAPASRFMQNTRKTAQTTCTRLIEPSELRNLCNRCAERTLERQTLSTLDRETTVYTRIGG